MTEAEVARIERDEQAALAGLNDTLEDAFRHRYPGFRPADDNQRATTAAA